MALPLLNAAGGRTGLGRGAAPACPATVMAPSLGSSQAYVAVSADISGAVVYCPAVTSTRSQRPVRVRYMLSGHDIGTWKLISPSWVNARVPSLKAKPSASGSHWPPAR